MYNKYENVFVDETIEYQKTINKLKSIGYIIQVADAYDSLNRLMNSPTKMHLAIYIKRADGKNMNRNEFWEKYDNKE